MPKIKIAESMPALKEKKGGVVYGLGWCHLCGRQDIMHIETSLVNRHGDEVPVCEDCIKAVRRTEEEVGEKMGDNRCVQIIVTVISEEENIMTAEHRNDIVAHTDSYTFLQSTPITKILLEAQRCLRELEEYEEL